MGTECSILHPAMIESLFLFRRQLWSISYVITASAHNLQSSCLSQISVNASILSDSGGPCVCPTGDGCVTDPVYLTCVSEVRRELITSTAAISALSSFLMGLLANLPVGLAPGLGLNAYVRVAHVFLVCGTDSRK
jgi:xanthine/uracil/vitamin C permease (AzgA family)